MIRDSQCFKHAYYFTSVHALKLVTYTGIFFVSIASLPLQKFLAIVKSPCMVKAFELVLIS